MVWDLNIWDCGDLRVLTSIGTILTYFEEYAERQLLSLAQYQSSETKLPLIALVKSS